MKQQEILVPVLIVAVLALVAGFFGGMKYQQSKVPSFGVGGLGNGRNFVGGPGVRGGSGTFGAGNRGGVAFRPVSGEILKADEKSITVKLQDGSSKIVILSETTAINKASEANKADLKVGETVAVFGTNNTDGSVTAQNIQLNPIMREFRMQASPSSTITQ